MSTVTKTPLYEQHIALGARMVEFGGWLMPVQYEGILTEHESTRRSAGLFDTCHMGQLRVTGVDARAGLSRILTADVATLRPGRCRYGFMLNEQGGIIDDLIVYALAADAWLLVVNAGTRDKDVDWLSQQIRDDVRVEDISAHRGKLDVQGPSSPGIVSRVLQRDVSALGRFQAVMMDIPGGAVMVSRTGYTGEDGYEVYADAGSIPELWKQFTRAGARPAGLGARDTLRLEAGLPLYGHELTETVTPIAAGLTRFAAKAGAFIGSAALRRLEAAGGPAHRLKGFRIRGRQSARHGHKVVADNAEIGWVTSGSFSPTLGDAIGMAYVRRERAATGGRIGIDIGRKQLDAELVDVPFYRRPNAGPCPT